MDKQLLKFKFKGSRTYVHGTDIYNQICNYIINKLNINDINNIKMLFRQIMHSHLLLEMYKNIKIKRSENTCVEFTFENNDDKYKIILSESGEKIDGRYEYYEDQITDCCDINKKESEICLNKKLDYTNMEIFVAMNKKILETICDKGDGKWYFAKLTLDKHYEDFKYNEIKIKVNDASYLRFTDSLIFLDNKKIGNIYFSLKS